MYGPGVDSASNRKQYQEFSWGNMGLHGLLHSKLCRFIIIDVPFNILLMNYATNRKVTGSIPGEKKKMDTTYIDCSTRHHYSRRPSPHHWHHQSSNEPFPGYGHLSIVAHVGCSHNNIDFDFVDSSVSYLWDKCLIVMT
jgi:hypothetical protein